MTYEMAGGGRGGLALTLADGSVLTLADRVARHLTTSLSTVRTASRNARRLVEDYVAGRGSSAAGSRVYLWPGDQQEARALADLLALHGVRVQQLAQTAEVPVRHLKGGEETTRRFAAGAYVVSTAQPLGNLIEALMQQEAPMAESFLERQRQRLEQNLDPEFYDITAWSLPLAYNVETWVASREPGSLRPLAEPGKPEGGLRGDGRLGWLVPPQGLASYRLAAQLQRRHIGHRIALAPFTSGGTAYPRGTLFIPRHGNPEDLQAMLEGVLRDNGLTGQAVATSFDIKGLSLGFEQHAHGAPGPHRPALRRRGGRDLLRLSLVAVRPADRLAARPDRRGVAAPDRPLRASTSWSCPAGTTRTASASGPGRPWMPG